MTLFIVGVLAAGAAFAFGGAGLQGSDALAQTTADAALDAAVSVLAQTGNINGLDISRLATENPTIGYVASGVSSPGSDTASVGLSSGVFAAAVAGSDGSCWMLRAALAALNADAPRRYVVIPAGVERDCNGDNALAVGTLAASGERGTSWRRPVVWDTAGRSGSSLLTNAAVVFPAGTSQQIASIGTNAGLTMTRGATASAEGDDPLALEFHGEPYIHLPGSVGNAVETIAPDAGIDTFSFSVRAEPESWLPPVRQTIVAFSHPDGFEIALDPAGLALTRTTNENGTQTVVIPVASGVLADRQWLRIELDGTTGDYSVSHAADQRYEPAAWGEVASGQSSALAGTLAASSNTLTIGAGAAQPLAGAIYKFALTDEQGSTRAALDASLCASDMTSCGGGNGDSWVLTQTPSGSGFATVVTRDVLHFGDHVAHIAHDSFLEPDVSQPLTFLAAVAVPAGAEGVLFAKRDTAGFQLALTAGQLTATLDDGTTSISASVGFSEYGEHAVLAVRFDPTAATIALFGPAGSVSTAWSGPYTGFTTANPLVVGQRGPSTATGNSALSMDLSALVIFDTALSDSELATTMAELASPLS